MENSVFHWLLRVSQISCSDHFVCLSPPSEYWPLFLLFFYILSPIPYCISRRVVDDTDSASNACKELAIFLTTGIVVSAFGLPIIFARASVVISSSYIENKLYGLSCASVRTIPAPTVLCKILWFVKTGPVVFCCSPLHRHRWVVYSAPFVEWIIHVCVSRSPGEPALSFWRATLSSSAPSWASSLSLDQTMTSAGSSGEGETESDVRTVFIIHTLIKTTVVYYCHLYYLLRPSVYVVRAIICCEARSDLRMFFFLPFFKNLIYFPFCALASLVDCSSRPLMPLLIAASAECIVPLK